MRTGFSIRTKLLLVALLLLLIPWMSYIYVRDMKAFLLSGQEDALSLTSRAVATVLHDRPELFVKATKIDEKQPQGNEVYAFPLPNFININGDLSDWGEQSKQAVSFSPAALDAPLLTTDTAVNNDLLVNHVLGYRGKFIYALFEVTDNHVLFRQKDFLRLDAADHIRLSLQDVARPTQRYTLSASGEGRMSIYSMNEDWQYPITGQPNYDMAAELTLSDKGYNVELRVPRYILTSNTRISLVVADVDDTTDLEVKHLLPTTPQTGTDDLSRLLVQSPEMAKILKGLGRADTRIWVIDKDKRVRTVVGNLRTDSDADQLAKPFSTKQDLAYFWAYARYYYGLALQSIFSSIIEQPAASLKDHDRTVEARNDQIITLALQGTISSDRRPSLDEQGTILMSAHPIYLDDTIPGAVIVEQSTNHVLQRQQETLENVISVTLLVLVTVATALLWFASRLAVRIRRLRNATDGAIDRDGRIINPKLRAEAKSGDEIGDLSRSVSNMLERLSQYTSYLRGLPDTLAHEVSNPLNVVNSSLHNLSQQSPEIAQSKYLERAKNGINRIGSILRNLTEAANLEQALQTETREKIDITLLIESYVDGYSFSNPEQMFNLTINDRPLLVQAAPDYIAQALDKLVDNAIDFAARDTEIVFRAKKVGTMAQIDVINQGSSLPADMAERIFEPLVSLGRKDAQKTRLGMGLYIVKLIASFHGGDVVATNLTDSQGVIFSLTLPLYDDEAN